MIDLRYLRAFQAVAKALSFTEAARAMNVSVSALSRQIALLEQNVSGELFIRNTRQVFLTPLGNKLFASAESFDRTLLSLNDEIPIRIGCLQSVFEFFLVELIQRNPDAFGGPLDVVIGTPNSLQGMISSGELDLVLTNIKPDKSSPFSGVRVFQETVTWIGEESSSGRPIIFSASEHFYPKELSKKKNRIRVNSFNATVAMAQRGLGNALVAVPAQLSNKKEPSFGKQWIYAVVPNYQRAPEPLRKIMESLRSAARV